MSRHFVAAASLYLLQLKDKTPQNEIQFWGNFHALVLCVRAFLVPKRLPAESTAIRWELGSSQSSVPVQNHEVFSSILPS